MAQIVVLVPGVCGSTLVNKLSGSLGFPVWLNYQRLALGGMAMLELDATGTNPAYPAIVGQIQPTGLLSAYYSIPYLFFSSKVRTLTFAYDWRLGNVANGQQLATYLSNALKTNTVYLVCHSMGGLVGRNAEFYLRTDPNYANLTRVVLIGTPNFGSFEAAKNLVKIPTWLAPTARLIGRSPAGPLYSAAVSYLSGVIAHYKSVMEMLPDGWNGPWQNVASVLAMYQLQSYNGLNSSVNQYLLTWGENFHKGMPSILNSSLYLCVVGYGQNTAVNLNEGSSLADKNEYHYSNQGDSVVPLLSAQLPGIQTISTPADHSSMPSNQGVLDALWSALTGQSSGNIVLN